MTDGPDITIRNSHGAVAGRISRAADGAMLVTVVDEESRWLVELAAERAGAPARPRSRPSCITGGSSGPGAVPEPGSASPSTRG